MTRAAIFLRYVPLLAMLLAATVTDVRARRIPNWLTFSMMIAGLAQSFCSIRTVGPLASSTGLIVGFALSFLLFVIGAMCAGDVKIMAGVGAWVGPMPVVAVFAITQVIGMVIVLAQAVYQGRLRTLLTNTTVLTINLIHLQDVGIDHARATGQSHRSLDQYLPFAVPVLLALLVMLARQ
jgi:prepilin peptidase CpaA